MSVTITGAVKSNLLALQTISAEAAKTQNVLSTGKKVNSALDNATSFFTASSLNSRAGSLTGLLDSVSNGVQTIQAANNGITSINKLIDQLKSTAQQALSTSTAYSSQASKTLTAITGATSADLRGNVGSSTASKTIDSTTLTDTTAATATSAATTATLVSGTGTITVGDGTTTKTYTYDTSATASDAAKFKDAADLNTKLAADGVKANAAASGSNLKLTASDTGTSLSLSSSVANFWAASTAAGTATTYNAAFGDALTVSDGTNTASLHYDSTGKSANSFKDIASLNSALATANVKATATDDGTGKLKLSAADLKTTLAVSGAANAAGKLNVATSIATTGLQDKSLRFSVGTGNALQSVVVKFGDPADGAGAIKSLDDLNSKLATVGLTGSVDSTGAIKFTTTGDTASKSFTITADATVAGLTGGTAAASSSAVRGGSGADSRDALVSQYNGLLSQIDTLAKDASFNGLNLLKGDTLNLTFNETSTSKLSVTGQDATSSGLGLKALGSSDFTDGGAINSVISTIDTSKSSLSNLSSKLGANLAVVQTRQDFTKSLSNTLTTGADNLVNADMNEEATKLLALQTSQQLAQSSISLANQSAQGVLRLLQ